MRKWILCGLCLCILCIPVLGKKKEAEYTVFVDVRAARLYVLEDGREIRSWPCAGGAYQTPSPVGTWRIIEKATWGEGFGGHWMGLNCPWGKFGIHGTSQPETIGYSASHGCIRMYNQDAAALYKLIPYGTRVIIQDGEYGVFSRGFRRLQAGMYGADVWYLQRLLIQNAYLHGQPDGKYGENTKKAVIRFQEDNGLPVTGKADAALWKRIGAVQME